MPYKHTQTGYLMIIVLGVSLVLLSFAMGTTEFDQVPMIVFIIVLLVLAMFSTLTVEIDQTKLTIKFGPGVIKKKFDLRDIQSCQSVKNRWFYGWGIRLTPHGWLYNVSGLKAVEVQLKNGKKFRVGTDEPEKLEFAIRERIR